MAHAPLTHPILTRLSRGILPAAALSEALAVSQSAVARSLRRLTEDGRVLRIGTTRGARYALRRDLEGIGSQWPLRQVDRGGEIHELGTLHALAAGHYFIALQPAALDAGVTIGGVTDSMPYLLQDQRPGGFLGRAVPRRYPEFRLPTRVHDWTDDHYLRYLTQRGSDTVGDLVVGNVAFDDYLAGNRQRPVIAADRRATRFPELAEVVMEGGLPGSSAHGEHPKFAAVVEHDGEPRPILVKFSPPRGTAVGERWSDLLVAEHLAHSALGRAGVPTCESAIHEFDERTYLEVARFDRHGAIGRIGVTSLLAIDMARYGTLDSWVASATRLHADRCLDASTLEQVRLADVFGALIANSDRHFGNLAFYDDYRGTFRLAPIYDMLPMLFAPEHDQVVARVFTPPDPTSATLAAWPQARALAEDYWQVVADDPRVSAGFRELCLASLKALTAHPDHRAARRSRPD